MVVSRRKSSLLILHSSLPSVFWNMLVSISNRPYSLMAHSSHWRTWSWDHSDGSGVRERKRRERVFGDCNNWVWEESGEESVERVSLRKREVEKRIHWKILYQWQSGWNGSDLDAGNTTITEKCSYSNLLIQTLRYCGEAVD